VIYWVVSRQQVKGLCTTVPPQYRLLLGRDLVESRFSFRIYSFLVQRIEALLLLFYATTNLDEEIGHLDEMALLRGSKTTAEELPHSRFIPESDRGWKTSSGSSTPPSNHDRRHSSILHLGSIWLTPLGKLKAMVPGHLDDEAVDDEEVDADEEEDEDDLRIGHGRERSNSMPSSIRSGETPRFPTAGQVASSSVTLMSIQMPPDSHSPIHDQNVSTPFERPFVVPREEFGESTLTRISSSTSSHHSSRGYPWRKETVDGQDAVSSFFVPPSHRNATGSQAFYDTHFGSSSNWRSVTGIADDNPYRHIARKKLSKWTHSSKEKRTEVVRTRRVSEERKKESLISWPNMNSFGSLGLNNFMSSSSKRHTSDTASHIQAYEPVLLPSVHRDPHASQYFKNLKGNVVIMGGYRGSILRDSETHQMMWVPLKVGANLRKPTLTLGLTPDAEEHSEDYVVAGEMMGGISSMVDMGKRLIHRCSTKRTMVKSWGYDWRLSLGRSSKKLEAYLYDLWEQSADNEADRTGAKVIAHSMGGLVALHALARSKRPEMFDSLVFASCPFLGASNILGPMRFGDIAMFNEEICSPRATFSFRSSFYLLPNDALEMKDEKGEQKFNTRGGRCFEEEDGTPVDLDFLDAETWDDLGLSPCVALGKRKEVLERSSQRAKSKGLSLGHQLERSASKRHDQGLDQPSYDHTRSDAVPSFSMGMDMNPTSPSDKQSASEEAGKAGQAILDHTVSGVDKESNLQAANRQQPDPTQQHLERKESTLSKEELSEIREDEASESWLYLERTLAEVRQFVYDLRTGFSQDYFEQGRYPHIAILTSGSTPTVRGALLRPRVKGAPKDHWKETVRDGDYSRMLYAPGDGIITRRSSTAIPGDWGKLLVRGKEDDPSALTNDEGVVETNHRHITLLSDVDAVGRCLEACRRARADQ
jgi:hypothetical protein